MKPFFRAILLLFALHARRRLADFGRAAYRHLPSE